MKKRILSVLIALCILMAFIPGGVRAYNGIKYGDYLYYEFTENSDAIWITDCDELAEGEIVIPAQIDGLPVIAIGDYAFDFDNRMVFADEMPTISIAIPDSITNIGKDVFRGAVIKSINVDAGNKYYSSENGNLYNKNKQTLITYAEKQEHEFIIPTGVTNISDRAFEGCSLESIKIPDGVTRIGRSAFSYCDSLVNINIRTV